MKNPMKVLFGCLLIYIIINVIIYFTYYVIFISPFPRNKSTLAWKCWNNLCTDVFSGNTMMDFTFLSDKEAWAVGSSGFISRWNGESWEGIPSPTQNTLHAVVFNSPNDGWAVGYKNSILHWDGNNWLQYIPPEIKLNPQPKDVMFEDIKFFNSTDGWISGAWELNNGMKGVILHWDGFNWKYVEENTDIISSSNCLCSIDIISTNNVWIVGDSEKPIASIIHWGGTTWSNLQNVIRANGSLHVIRALGENDIWIIGEEKILLSEKIMDWYSRGYLLNWNGQQWNKIILPERWNDETIYSQWTKKPKDQTLLSMFVQSPQNIIVGGNVHAQWNGKEWSEIEVPRDDILVFDIEMNPNGKLFAITSNGLYLGLYGK
jgi:hypothetical protein